MNAPVRPRRLIAVLEAVHVEAHGGAIHDWEQTGGVPAAALSACATAAANFVPATLAALVQNLDEPTAFECVFFAGQLAVAVRRQAGEGGEDALARAHADLALPPTGASCGPAITRWLQDLLTVGNRRRPIVATRRIPSAPLAGLVPDELTDLSAGEARLLTAVVLADRSAQLAYRREGEHV